MKNIITILLVLTSFASIKSQCPENFHNFSAIDIRGNNLDMNTFIGKKVLVVNTASYCGYTDQYAQLQELYDTYGGPNNPYNFEIIGFPANNFMNQEPYNEDSIQNVCDSYGVTFTMMSKISVKGTDQHEIYKWLTLASRNCVQNATVTWNFQKFMINPDGSWHSTAAPATSPTHSSIVNWITTNVSIANHDKNQFSITLKYKNIYEIKNINNDNYTVKIFNITGQKLAHYNFNNSSAELNLNNLSKGIYLIQISSLNNSYSEKIRIP